jgi:hypothetical protein
VDSLPAPRDLVQASAVPEVSPYREATPRGPPETAPVALQEGYPRQVFRGPGNPFSLDQCRGYLRPLLEAQPKSTHTGSVFEALPATQTVGLLPGTPGRANMVGIGVTRTDALILGAALLQAFREAARDPTVVGPGAIRLYWLTNDLEGPEVAAQADQAARELFTWIAQLGGKMEVHWIRQPDLSHARLGGSTEMYVHAVGITAWAHSSVRVSAAYTVDMQAIFADLSATPEAWLPPVWVWGSNSQDLKSSATTLGRGPRDPATADDPTTSAIFHLVADAAYSRSLPLLDDCRSYHTASLDCIFAPTNPAGGGPSDFNGLMTGHCPDCPQACRLIRMPQFAITVATQWRLGDPMDTLAAAGTVLQSHRNTRDMVVDEQSLPLRHPTAQRCIEQLGIQLPDNAYNARVGHVLAPSLPKDPDTRASTPTVAFHADFWRAVTSKVALTMVRGVARQFQIRPPVAPEKIGFLKDSMSPAALLLDPRPLLHAARHAQADLLSASSFVRTMPSSFYDRLFMPAFHEGEGKEITSLGTEVGRLPLCLVTDLPVTDVLDEVATGHLVGLYGALVVAATMAGEVVNLAVHQGCAAAALGGGMAQQTLWTGSMKNIGDEGPIKLASYHTARVQTAARADTHRHKVLAPLGGTSGGKVQLKDRPSPQGAVSSRYYAAPTAHRAGAAGLYRRGTANTRLDFTRVSNTTTTAPLTLEFEDWELDGPGDCRETDLHTGPSNYNLRLTSTPHLKAGAHFDFAIKDAPSRLPGMWCFASRAGRVCVLLFLSAVAMPGSLVAVSMYPGTVPELVAGVVLTTTGLVKDFSRPMERAILEALGCNPGFVRTDGPLTNKNPAPKKPTHSWDTALTGEGRAAMLAILEDLVNGSTLSPATDARLKTPAEWTYMLGLSAPRGDGRCMVLLGPGLMEGPLPAPQAARLAETAEQVNLALGTQLDFAPFFQPPEVEEEEEEAAEEEEPGLAVPLHETLPLAYLAWLTSKRKWKVSVALAVDGEGQVVWDEDEGAPPAWALERLGGSQGVANMQTYSRLPVAAVTPARWIEEESDMPRGDSATLAGVFGKALKMVADLLGGGLQTATGLLQVQVGWSTGRVPARRLFADRPVLRAAFAADRIEAQTSLQVLSRLRTAANSAASAGTSAQG